MRLSERPRLDGAIREAQVHNLRIDWQTSMGTEDGKGSCIPIAVYTAAFLQARGIAARPMEAAARFVDPVLNRSAEIVDADDKAGWDALNEPGLPFIGHLVTGIPTFQAVADFSLPSQTFETLRDELPDVLLAFIKPHQVGFRAPLGRGHALYRIFPRRDGWRHRNWPYEAIRKRAREDAND